MENIESIKQQLCEILTRGLVAGVGDPEPGKFCAEAAICYVLGEPHGDRPTCVHAADREMVISLNDNFPGNEYERAEALKPILLAHLGTAGKSRVAWACRIAIETIRVILPIALEAAASVHPQEAHRVALRAAAQRCAEAPDAAAARAAVGVARAAAYAAADADAARAAAAANAAANAAYAAANAAYAAAARAAAAANAAAAAADDAAYATAAAKRRGVFDRFISIVVEAYTAEEQESDPTEGT